MGKSTILFIIACLMSICAFIGCSTPPERTFEVEKKVYSGAVGPIISKAKEDNKVDNVTEVKEVEEKKVYTGAVGPIISKAKEDNKVDNVTEVKEVEEKKVYMGAVGPLK